MGDRERESERESAKKENTAGNFMKIMTIIVIKSKMLSNCLINLLCKLCGRQTDGRKSRRARGRSSGTGISCWSSPFYDINKNVDNINLTLAFSALVFWQWH